MWKPQPTYVCIKPELNPYFMFVLTARSSTGPSSLSRPSAEVSFWISVPDSVSGIFFVLLFQKGYHL